MQIKEIIDYLNERLKPEYQENYDNAGFLLGNPDDELKGVLVCVDVTPEVVEEAVEVGANMILSHHPLIFSGLKQITTGDQTGRMVTKLIKKGISVYAAHTNLDNLGWGVNGILAEKLGLVDCQILRPTKESMCDSQIGAGMVGRLPKEMNVVDFLRKVKDIVGVPVIRCSRIEGQKGTNVRRVAICGGSGSFLIGDAKASGADVYLTADLKYHDFQAAESKIVVADIGHFESEQFIKEIFLHVLSEKNSNFAVYSAKNDNGYVAYI